MERRTFLKASALGAGVAFLEGCARREVQYLVQPLERPEGRPGEGVWKPSVCGQCPSGCGTLVRVIDGDARKVEGQRAHPVNHGGLCPLGQAALQGHYDPDRVTAPRARRAGGGGEASETGSAAGAAAAAGTAAGSTGSPADGASEADTGGPSPRADRGPLDVVSWDEALTQAAEAIARAAADDPSAVVFVDGSGNTFLHALLARLADALGAPAPVALVSPQAEVERRAAEIALGFDTLPAYDLPRSDYILSIGPAFLDRGHQPVWSTWAMSRVRGGTPGRRGKLVQAEARMSLTAAFADEWLPVVPGEEGRLARALAGVLLAETPQRGDAASYAALYPEPAPSLAEAARHCGLAESTLRRVARELARADRPVVLAGGSAAVAPDGLAHTTAALALNLLLGAVGRPGGVFPSASFGIAASLHPGGEPAPTSVSALEARLRGIGGVPRVLVVCEGDPAHTRPGARGWRGGLDQVETVVVLTTALDDTAALADVVLPLHSDVERFQAAEPSGLAFPVLGVAAPAVKPIADTRHPGDVVLALATALDRAAEMPWDGFQAMVEQAVTARAAVLPGGAGADPAQVWREALERGGAWSEEPPAMAAPASAASPPRGTRVLGEPIVGETIAVTEPSGVASESTGPSAIGEPAPAGAAGATAPRTQEAAAAGDELTLLLFESPKYGDGRGANKAWLQELPDTLTTVMWSGWAEVAARDAVRLGVATGDLVEIATDAGTIEVPAVVRPEARPGTVALPLGTGHRDYGRYARGRGANPLDLVGVETVGGTTAPALSGRPARVRRAGAARLAIYGRGLREAEHIPVGWAPMKNGH